MIGVTLSEIRILRYRPRVARYQAAPVDTLSIRLSRELASYGHERIPLVEILHHAAPSDVAGMLQIRWTEGGLDAAREIARRTAERLLAPCVPDLVAELRAALDTGIPLTREARARAYAIDDGPPDRRATAARERLLLAAVVAATELSRARDLDDVLATAVHLHGVDELRAQRRDLVDVLSRPVPEVRASTPILLSAGMIYAAHVDPGDLAASVGASDSDLLDVRTWIAAEPDTAIALHLVTIAGGGDVVRAVARRAADRLRARAVDDGARIATGRIDALAASDPLAAVAVVACHSEDRVAERAAQRADLLELLST